MDVVYCDTKLADGFRVRLESRLNLAGWQIVAWNPEENARLADLAQWLEAKRIKPLRQDGESWFYAEFGFEESAAVVAAKYQELISAVGEHLSYGVLLRELFSQNGDLILDDCEVGYTRFAPMEWREIPRLLQCNEWTSSRLIVLFEFDGQGESIDLFLVVGAGSSEVREKLFDLARANPQLFRGADAELRADGWIYIINLYLFRKNYG